MQISARMLDMTHLGIAPTSNNTALEMADGLWKNTSIHLDMTDLP